MPCDNSKILTALACADTTTRDAAVFRDVADGSFSFMPTMERRFVEFAKNDGYNAYFQDLFALSLHLKWEGCFAVLGDIGTLRGKVPTGMTAGVLRLLEDPLLALRHGTHVLMHGGLRRDAIYLLTNAWCDGECFGEDAS